MHLRQNMHVTAEASTHMYAERFDYAMGWSATHLNLGHGLPLAAAECRQKLDIIGLRPLPLQQRNKEKDLQANSKGKELEHH